MGGRIGPEKVPRPSYIPYRDDLEFDPTHRASPLNQMSMGATDWRRTVGSRKSTGVYVFDGYWEHRDHWRIPDPNKPPASPTSSAKSRTAQRLARSKSTPDCHIFTRQIESFRTMPIV